MRETITIYAEPTREEIIRWAESALRNCPDGTVNRQMLESLIADFADGLSALRAIPAVTLTFTRATAAAHEAGEAGGETK